MIIKLSNIFAAALLLCFGASAVPHEAFAGCVPDLHGRAVQGTDMVSVVGGEGECAPADCSCNQDTGPGGFVLPAGIGSSRGFEKPTQQNTTNASIMQRESKRGSISGISGSLPEFDQLPRYIETYSFLL